MTATLEASASAGSPDEPPNDSASPDDTDSPDEPRRPIPAALAPWHDPHPWVGWLATLSIAILAGFTRFWALGFPPGKNAVPMNGLNFDEAYYPVEAQEMLRYGYEDNRGYLFIVHPPLGKWLIAGSEWFVGALDGQHSSSAYLSNSMGWRIAPALAGVLGVVLFTRIVRRVTRSNLFGFIGGLLLALDGMSLVLARTGILDIFLQLFIIAAFGALVIDRDKMRARLAGLIADGVDLSAGAPTLGPRPWRLVGGVMLGLACGVKWTAFSFFLAFVLLSLLWDRSALRAAGVRRPTRTWARRSVLPAIGSLLIVPLGTYLLCWIGWFTGENSYGRYYADTQPTHGFGWVPESIRSLYYYTYHAYKFHEGLYSPHVYGSKPWSWLVLGRPVDFYYVGTNGAAAQRACGASSCSREILLIGTPLMWWAFAPMLLWLAWHWFTTRDWRAGAIWLAFGAGWLVWFQDLRRTMFLFYMAPLVPFLILGVVLGLGVMIGPARARPGRPRLGFLAARDVAGSPRVLGMIGCGVVVCLAAALLDGGLLRDVLVVGFGLALLVILVWDVYERWFVTPPDERRRFWGAFGTSIYLGLVVADFAWMWPIFTGGLLTYNEWHAHMWLPSWV